MRVKTGDRGSSPLPMLSVLVLMNVGLKSATRPTTILYGHEGKAGDHGIPDTACQAQVSPQR